eukprot:Gb_01964 [translate_table: standard]
MGCSSSRIEDDKIVLLCRERKRFIKQAIDQRYALATAHVAYIQALRSIGIALRHFAEGEMKLESSLPTSPTTTSEPVVLHEKSPFPSPSATPSPSPSLPSSPPVERADSSPPPESTASHDDIASPPYASPLKMNYMRSGANRAMTIEERPPSPKIATMDSYSTVPRSGKDPSVGTSMPAATPSPSSSHNQSLPPPSPSQSFSWEYFNPFTALENPYHFPDQGKSIQTFEADVFYMKQLREEEGIPDLEDAEQAEEGRQEEIKEVHLEESTSKAVLTDSDKNHSETVSKQDVDTAAKDHTEFSNVNAFSQAPREPSVKAMTRSTAEHCVDEIHSSAIEEANEAVAGVTLEKVDILEANKEVTGKEALLEKDVTTFVAHRARNLLASIKDIEEQFIRASEAGKEVSRMLESNKVHYHSSFAETEEPSSKILNVITWHRSASSLSSSSKMPPASSSKDGIDDSSSDFGEDFCMISGSHASTLDRLYAWEKKLYDEVKAGECIQREYEKKCLQLRHQDAKGKAPQVIDKTRAAVKDLHSRIRVAIHAVDSISKRVEKLRDEELQPQLAELRQGLIRMWKMMGECHQTQHRIISEANSLGRSAVSGVSSDSHHQATVQLANELHNWQMSFSNWINAQKAYIESLKEWLLKCIVRTPEVSTKGRMGPLSPRRVCAPPICIIYNDWSRAFGKIPEKVVIDAIRSLEVGIRALWAHQDEQQHQMRKTENHAKDLDKRVFSLQRDESRMLDTQLSSREKQKSNNPKAGTSMEDKKMSVDSFRKRVEEEKARHHKVIQETHNSTLSSLQKGLASIFESLTRYASESVHMYENLDMNGGNAQFPYENSKMLHI